MSIQNGHGGARVGAGRKPKALIYANEIAVAESMMVGALPRVTAKLIALAEAGDVPAIRLLFDRIMGRPAQLDKPLSKDTSIPYVEDDLNRDLMGRFINDCDTDDMLDRQFGERFRRLDEDDAVDDDSVESETVAPSPGGGSSLSHGVQPMDDLGAVGDEANNPGAHAGKPSAPHSTRTPKADDSGETPCYYYEGTEVKFGIRPSTSHRPPSNGSKSHPVIGEAA